MQSVLYRLMVLPISRIHDREFRDLAVALQDVKGMSKVGNSDDQEVIQYSSKQDGETVCMLELSRRGVALETAKKGIPENDWDEFRIDTLKCVSDAVGWKANALRTFSVIRRYRVPEEGNAYETILDRYLKSTAITDLMKTLPVFDVDLTVDCVLRKDICLQLRITSNQSRTEALEATPSDSVRILVELHAYSLRLSGVAELSELGESHCDALDDWISEHSALEALRLEVPSD